MNKDTKEKNSVSCKEKYDGIIKGLLIFLVFIAPLSRAGINIVAPILLIIWLFKKVKFRKEPEEKFRYPEILKWTGLLGLAVLFSLINVEDFSAALKNLVEEYLLFSVIFIISLDVIKTKEQLKKMFKAGLISLLLVGGWGLYEYLVIGHSRIESTFSVATQTGVYFASTVLLVLAFLLFIKKVGRPTLFGSALLLFLNLLCLIMTGTRAAWLGFFVGATFLLIIAFKNHKVIGLKKIIVVLVIFIVATAFVDPGWIFDRLTSITDLSNGSNRQRIMMFQGGVEMLKDHPLTGIGIGQFRLAYADYRPPGAKLFTHIHCFYLHLAAELGLIGLFVFLTLVYKVIKLGITLYARLGKEKSWFYYGVLGALVGIGVCNLFDWTFLNLQIGTFTLILVAMWLNAGKQV